VAQNHKENLYFTVDSAKGNTVIVFLHWVPDGKLQNYKLTDLNWHGTTVEWKPELGFRTWIDPNVPVKLEVHRPQGRGGELYVTSSSAGGSGAKLNIYPTPKPPPPLYSAGCKCAAADLRTSDQSQVGINLGATAFNFQCSGMKKGTIATIEGTGGIRTSRDWNNVDANQIILTATSTGVTDPNPWYAVDTSTNHQMTPGSITQPLSLNTTPVTVPDSGIVSFSLKLEKSVIKFKGESVPVAGVGLFFGDEYVITIRSTDAPRGLVKGCPVPRVH
jgi:hypothetical protein